MASLMKYLSILIDATIKTLAKLFNLILKTGQYQEQWNKLENPQSTNIVSFYFYKDIYL
jgi:hypothetical protein